MNRLFRYGVPFACLGILALDFARSEERSSVPYPTDYRTWAVVKTVMVGPQSKFFAARGGFHHFYANSKAMEGYRSGIFPDGSVIVDEGVYAKDNNGVSVEGELRSVEVMHKDSVLFRSTGDWGFDRFEGTSKTSVATAEARTVCFNCHAGRKDRDYVFSSVRK